MRVLVTGATGFVAGHLLPALVAAGHDVVALGHDGDRIPAQPGVTPLVLDLERFDDGDLPQADAIVHLAQANVPWPEQASRLFAVNVASTQRLLEHARRCGAACFVHASSASVYGPGDRPFHEDDEPRGRDFYAVTKRSAELLVAAYAADLAVTSLRLVAPYGPGQVRRLVPGLIGRVRQGSPVTLNAGGRPAMNPIYVADAVRAIEALLAGSGPGGGLGALNLAGDETVTIRGLAEAIGVAAGILPVFEEAPGGGTVAGDIVCDNARLRGLLGASPLTPLSAGLARTLAESPAA